MIPTPLSTGQKTLRLLLIGLVPLVILVLFLWAGGWLTPERLTSDKLVSVLQQAGGEHPGYRRNHAKGICVIGTFASNGNASALSRAALFAPGDTPVTGRFAIAGGNPSAPDYAVPVRSMALAFQQKDGEQWRTGMNAMPLFPVATPEGFYALQTATLPDPATGKPDPQKLGAFVEKYPEFKAFLAWAKQYVPSSSWASDRFNSLNAFRFIDKTGAAHLVRWSMVPHAAYQAISAADKNNKDFLQQDLQQRLNQGPLEWDLVITVAQPGDDGSNATKVWPADRQTINAGTLVLTRAVPQQQGPCNDINYDPLILPDGIAASDDPLLNARSAAYAKSYNLRTHEQAQQTGTHL
ncbi:catalase family peroxidase [Pantoea phytobeneficialis]|uniref:Catalase-related peroxidase n=1 Tax=Pantoea phytobeneficialis TaxID=2052056 RepID=A0AAP9HB44_9GAMM|nr:catalase family peroxidase [Pantoea phytobeneficialis]MDO6407034.1 catalase family peroxidase [Pantoea phytobeneficialis]QGR09998.1 catalase [Pantoea phytobeneficialis]